MLTQLKNIGLSPEERQKITTSNGSWYCKKDDQDMLYMMLTNGSYPERLIYESINELREHLKKLGKTYSAEQDVHKWLLSRR